MNFEQLMNDILDEIKVEEKAEEERRKAIIKNGCPHTEKVERIGIFSGEHFWECAICKKQFNIDGTEVQ